MTASVPIHLMVIMAGHGSRFQRAGYTDPKPLIKVSGVPMIERLLSNYPAHWPTTFLLAEAHRSTSLPSLLTRLRPEASISYLGVETLASSSLRGPALSALKGLEGITSDCRLLVSYCDFSMVWDSSQFEEFVASTNCDACLISYRGFHAHYLSPLMYAYSRLVGDQVVEIREKGCFTKDREDEYASAGAYYFRSAKELHHALKYQERSGLKLNGEDYLSLTVQHLMTQRPDASVRVFEVGFFRQWGTPTDLQSFEYWERTFRSRIHSPSQKDTPPPTVSQLLIPMAGLGSRFQSIINVPKPFLTFSDRPMYIEAMASLPVAKQTHLAALEAHKPWLNDSLASWSSYFTKIRSRPIVSWLSETPSGQALTVAKALTDLDQDADLLVSACDHEIAFDASKWLEFYRSPKCDAAIFTVQGFPGAERSPNSYAYVSVKPDSGTFPEVATVSVKQPLSSEPAKDHLLVGTFWFRKTSVLAEGVRLLQRADIRVNGELYLDSVFELLMAAGLTVRVFHLDGYINRGDPDSLAESVYYQELFGGRLLKPRQRWHLGRGKHG